MIADLTTGLLLICIGKSIAREAAIHADIANAIEPQPEAHNVLPPEKQEQQTEEEHDHSGRYDDPTLSILHELRSTKPPITTKLQKIGRAPKGIIGTLVYYTKEAFTLLFLTSPLRSQTVSQHRVPSRVRALADQLESISQEAPDPSNALFLLAEMNFYGNFSHSVSYSKAFKYYQQLADLNGNSTAQYMLGFMYATGLNEELGQDQAKSMLYHSFAAEQGDTRSEMTLAYRNHMGISTTRDCEEAVKLYQRVADKAIDYYRSGPPGGHSLFRDAYRIADEVGGVYGEGASFSSAGINAKTGGPTSDAYADVGDVLEYLHFQSSKGDLKATFGLARLHYDGGRDMKRDFRTAKNYFMEVARQYWNSKDQVRSDVPTGVEKLAAKSAGYIGRMFLRGEGTKQSFTKARIWFERGIANGDALSQYSLGLMYLRGYGVKVKVHKAADLFSAAADQGLAVAQTELGVFFLDTGDVTTALKYFDLAASNSHIEAFYYLAELANQGIGRERSCATAAVHYKIVAEKAEPVWSSLEEANAAYDDGDKQTALIGYMMAAEQGCENAQANVAWILDQTSPKWSPLAWLKLTAKQTLALPGSANTALRFWTRSARQANLDSLVKMGDYYLTGIGLRSAQPEHAAACYQAAADTQQSAQAMWNLGWMHENGIGGMEQDFHLAKRYYDQALTTNNEAYFPVKISLWKLRWRSWYNRVTHGSARSIQDDDETAKPRRTLAEWIRDFLEADARLTAEEQAAAQQYEEDDWDSTAREQMADTDEYWPGEEDMDDDILVTLAIGGLIAVLGWLLWYRREYQRAAERRRQNEQPNAVAQPQDRGVFPAPGDPAFNQWAAGGVGH